ncbi:MAG: thiol:disulfide interchange protein DsbA [Halothiobacillaceae bacterium]|nr:MAG: thiol:disulfide interchange protein DsbA [Halothiobacillaceae bacterium]
MGTYNMKYILRLLMLTLLWPLLLSTTAMAIDYEEGIAYQSILPEQPTSTKEKIEVVELFWYGCPHCHRFEPFIERWLESKADYIEFVRVPAILRPEWQIHARAYYTAEALNVLDKIHTPLFEAIHNQKRKLNSEEELTAFFVELGIDEKAFKKAFKSFGVDAKVRRATEMGQRYGVSGTPAVVINGKYRTDGTICKCGFAEVMNIVDALAEKEHNLMVKKD